MTISSIEGTIIVLIEHYVAIDLHQLYKRVVSHELIEEGHMKNQMQTSHDIVMYYYIRCIKHTHSCLSQLIHYFCTSFPHDWIVCPLSNNIHFQKEWKICLLYCCIIIMIISNLKRIQKICCYTFREEEKNLKQS